MCTYIKEAAAMTRKEAALGVCPARLVCPWWARVIDSGFREQAKSGTEEQQIVENIFDSEVDEVTSSEN